jgi:glycosyltransferase involved in cell wall biosynthesis
LVTFVDKFSQHDICLKIHSKKSLNMPTAFGKQWRQHLYDQLMGDDERVKAIVATMLVDANLGLLMPQHYHGVASAIGIGENYELVRNILANINVALVPNQKLEFPSGSMFWFRSQALAQLARFGLDWHDFAHAMDDRDGTLAHGIERCFTFFCANAGKKWGFLPLRHGNPQVDARSLEATPVFSVIIPVYDRTWELREALDSVVSQSFADFEVIIVTDATPPETMAIVREYIARDSRVRAFFYADNSGNACRGRNRGIIEARGEFISLLDSDDLYFPDTLQKAYRIFREQQVDFVCGRAYYIVDGTRQVGKVATGSTNEVGPINVERLMRENPIQTCTVHMRRDLLIEFGGFRREQKYLEDLELWLRLAYRGCRFYYSNELFSKYRFHQGNLELKYIDQIDYWLEQMRSNYLRPFDNWGIASAAEPAASFFGDRTDQPGGAQFEKLGSPALQVKQCHAKGRLWSERVDAEWYLRQYPDVGRAGADPLDHFIKHGAREGRKPNAVEASTDGWISVTDVEISCLKRPSLHGEVALFVTHSANGRLKRHVRHYLDCLVRQHVAVVLIIAADEPFTAVGDDLMSRLDGMFVRQNNGYDFAAWAHILRLQPELTKANILYLLNDSVFGPTNDAVFGNLLEGIRNSSADLIGLTESFERGWHLQSYFLALKAQALSSVEFRDFLESIVCYRDKEQVIAVYELRFALIMKIAGFKCEAIFQKTDIHNPTIVHWRHLLSAGFPFLKVATVRGEDPRVDVSDWPQVLAAQGYDVSLAEQPDEASADRHIVHEIRRSLATCQSGRAHTRPPGLHILIFSHDLTESGAPRAAFDVARILRDDGHFVVVASPSDGPYRARLRDIGVDVILINPGNERAFWTPELLFNRGRDVLDLARNFDKVLCNTIDCWPVVAQLHNVIPVFWYVHESEIIHEKVRNTPELLPVLSTGITFLAPSVRPANALAAYGLKTRIVGYGVDDRRAWNSHRSGGDDGRVVIGVFGSYEPRKGQDLAVKGMLSVPHDVRVRAELKLFGRTLNVSFRNNIEQIAGGDRSIVFFGELGHDECVRQMAASDVILVPSRDDPLPFITLDALSLGKPLVCSSTTGTSAYLQEGGSGLILRENTPEEIGRKLARLIDKPKLRKMLGRGARGVYEKHFTVPLFRDRLFSALDMGEVFGNAAVDSSSTSVPEGVRQRYYGAV